MFKVMACSLKFTYSFELRADDFRCSASWDVLASRTPKALKDISLISLYVSSSLSSFLIPCPYSSKVNGSGSYNESFGDMTGSRPLVCWMLDGGLLSCDEKFDGLGRILRGWMFCLFRRTRASMCLLLIKDSCGLLIWSLG